MRFTRCDMNRRDSQPDAATAINRVLNKGTQESYRRLKATGRSFVQASAWLVQAIGTHPLPVLILPTIYFLVRFPPFWNGIDAVCQLVFPAGSVNILHHPPLYCFLARIPFWIADHALQGGSASIFSLQHPSLAAVYLLVCCQHAALCFALRYFVFSIPTTAFRRGLLTLLLASTASFYSFAHTCGSDAPVPVCWFLAFGSGIRVLQPGAAGRAWVVYGAALLFAIGSRHISGVLLIWLPALCGVLVVGHRLSPASNPGLGKLGKVIARALIIGACVWCGEKLIVAALCEHFRVIPRSTLGATLSDRISSLVAGLSDEAKAGLCARVESLTTDPLVRLAITSQIYCGPYYQVTGDVITGALVTRGLSGEQLDAERDRIILRSSTCFYRAVPLRLLKVAWRDFLSAMFRTSDTNLAFVGPYGNGSGALEALTKPAAWGAVRDLPIFKLSSASKLIRVVRANIFFKKWHRLPIIRWCVIFLAICIERVRRRTMSAAGFLAGLSIVGIGALCCFLSFVFIFYSPRYVLPLMVSVMAGGSVLSGILMSNGLNPQKSHCKVRHLRR